MCPRVKFQALRSSGSILYAAKTVGKEKYRTASILWFYILPNQKLNKVLYFHTIYCLTSSPDRQMSPVVWIFEYALPLLQAVRKQCCGVHHWPVLVPRFMKLDQRCTNWNVADTSAGCTLSLVCLRRLSQARQGGTASNFIFNLFKMGPGQLSWSSA